jgi:hypothetical protein
MTPPLACLDRLSETWIAPVNLLIGEGGLDMNGLDTSPGAVFGKRLFVGEERETEFKPETSDGVSGVLVSDLDLWRVGVLGMLAMKQ